MENFRGGERELEFEEMREERERENWDFKTFQNSPYPWYMAKKERGGRGKSWKSEELIQKGRKERK